ncbi:MAG TPA: hypothetical protein VGE23_01615, partial [Candidatus Paceibacterota bacterium]
VARTMADIMSDNQARVPSYNINNPLAFSDYDVAAKTGTTNESRDAWTVGYSPTLAVAVWAGNNDNSPMLKEIAGYIVAPMWRQFMDVALAKMPKEYFNEPPAIPQDVPPVLRGQIQWHSLLLLTDKNNPQGGAPLNPYGDPQLPYWESPIQAWAAGAATGFQNASSTEETVQDEDEEEEDGNRIRRNRDND